MTDWTRHVVLLSSANGKAHGSGFVVRRAGAVAHVVTCAHVVADLGDGLEANGRPAKVLWDGTKSGIDLAVIAAEGLTEEPLTLSRRAAVGDAVVAVGFTQVDRGRRATARAATIREATQLTYDPAAVVKKHAGWLLALDGEAVTDGFSGGPVVAADTGLVIGVLGLRGADTADAIAIGNLAAWADAPPAVSGVGEQLEAWRRSDRWVRLAALALAALLVATVGALIVVMAGRDERPITIETPQIWNGSVFASTGAPPELVWVPAVGGWQLSLNRFRAGDRLCLEPRGLAAVAAPDVLNLGGALRGLLVKHAAAGGPLAQLRRSVPAPVLTDANRFRFGWVGPEGGPGADPVLDGCRLRPDVDWGALLGTELTDLGYSDLPLRDPVAVLAEDRRAVDDLRVLGARREWVMTADGHLAFVINDAVVTDRFAPARPLCTDATRARAAAERALAADLAHNLAVQPPALAAYGDNAGGFMVAIRRGACPAASTMRTRP
jgi:hypothetical protein